MLRVMRTVFFICVLTAFFACLSASGEELAEEQVGKRVSALFERHYEIEFERRALAEEYWNSMDKEQQGRYVVSMPNSQVGPLRARDISREEAKKALDRAQTTMSPRHWSDTVCSENHLSYRFVDQMHG